MSPATALEQALSSALERRRKRAMLRALSDSPTAESKVDFSSNDYLSLARNPALRAHFLASLNRKEHVLGSGASRLLDGNSPDHIALEKRLAAFYRAPAALLFNSGFDANVGLFAALPQPGDAIVYDELIHASVHDGMRTSRVSPELRVPFRHNSVEGLRDTLATLLANDAFFATGRKSVFVAVEALYSMDGDFCPLAQVVRAVREFLPAGNGHIILDEAHSNGLCGPKGRGLAAHLGLENEILVRLHTFGKALGSSGGALLTTPLIRNYLINYARPLIYSTALAQFNVISIDCSLDFLEDGTTERLSAQMSDISSYFRTSVTKCLASYPTTELSLPPASSAQPLASPIIPVLCPSPRPCAAFIQSRGYMVRPITYPTVPKGLERIRICVHAANTRAEIDGLVEVLHEWLETEQYSWPKARL